MKKKIRNSNIELLRLISIFLIILAHSTWETNWYNFNNFNLSFAFVQSFWIGGKLGVNIFFLISGYFLINKTRFSSFSILKLLFDVLFYSWLILIVSFIFNNTNLNMKTVLMSVFPIIFNGYWFITVYFFLYLLSPFINRLILKLNKNNLILLLSIGFIYLFIFSTFFQNTTAGTGDTFITGLFMYMCGGFISKYQIMEKFQNSKFKLSILFFGLIIIMIFSIIGMDLLQIKGIVTTTPHKFALFINGNSPFQVLSSIVLFIIFLNIDLKYNKLINTLSKTTLAIYMLHTSYLTKDLIFKNWLHFENLQNSYLLIIYIPIIALCLMIFLSIIDLVKSFFTDKLKFYLIEKLSKNFLFQKLEKSSEIKE